MLEAINSALLYVADLFMGWMLHLHRDLVLVLVALGTALVLTLVRLFSTNQELLGRCKRDKARLKELLREAKKQRDKDAVKRHRTTIGQIGMLGMKAELKPLLAALLPIALLATWAFSRIAYVAPDGEGPVLVKAYFPTHLVGTRAHIVRQDGLEDLSGWYAIVQKNAESEKPYGVAEWTLQAAAQGGPMTLCFEHEGRTFERELTAGDPPAAEVPELVKAGPVVRFSRPAAPSPEGTERLSVKVFMPVDDVGSIVRLVARQGLQVGPGWIQRVVEDYNPSDGTVSNGVALWALRAEKRDEPYTLKVRFDGRTYEKELIVDGRLYAPPLSFYEADDDVVCTETVLPEYKLLGFVPGLPWLMLQPWIVGYLVIVLPLAFILKPVFRIH